VPPGQGAQTSALHRYRVGTSQPRYNLPATQRMPPGMTRHRRDSPATDIAERDAPAPSSAGTIRTSRQVPITYGTAGTIQAMLADSAGQDTHDPTGLYAVRRAG
jgi:hypothetical protein